MNVTLSLSYTITVDFFLLERFRGNFPTAHTFSFPPAFSVKKQKDSLYYTVEALDYMKNETSNRNFVFRTVYPRESFN